MWGECRVDDPVPDRADERVAHECGPVRRGVRWRAEERRGACGWPGRVCITRAPAPETMTSAAGVKLLLGCLIHLSCTLFIRGGDKPASQQQGTFYIDQEFTAPVMPRESSVNTLADSRPTDVS